MSQTIRNGNDAPIGRGWRVRAVRRLVRPTIRGVGPAPGTRVMLTRLGSADTRKQPYSYVTCPCDVAVFGNASLGNREPGDLVRAVLAFRRGSRMRAQVDGAPAPPRRGCLAGHRLGDAQASGGAGRSLHDDAMFDRCYIFLPLRLQRTPTTRALRLPA
jgi:hypothetical protein